MFDFCFKLLGCNMVDIKGNTFYKCDFYTCSVFKPVVSYYSKSDYSSLVGQNVICTFEPDVINNKLKLVCMKGE